ncbi:APC family permease [Paenibacillus jiagnxiensis]|uniref:APC family permease n=1 Tax=Paenibacillus jiagnxiensis TaxID=3228926 RepID=UPI0033BD6336
MKEENSLTLKRSLNTWQLILLGLGFMTPMVVFDTFGIASEETAGHVPASYVAALVALLFTAGSYCFMIRAFPNAGSAYTYTQKSFNPHLGFMVGWLALMDYMFLPMVNALIAQIYLTSLFPQAPAWIFVVLFVGIVTAINLLTVKGTARLNGYFVLLQLLVVLVFIGVAVWGLLQGKGSGRIWFPEAFFSTDISTSTLISGATLLCFSYLGFDAVAGFSEETATPTKTIPRALFLTALMGGLMFTVTSYFAQALFPNVSDFKDPEASTPEIALYLGGAIFQAIFLTAGFAGTIASAISSQASVSRLMYAMGRDGMLPTNWFRYLHPRSRTPIFNTLFVGLISLTAVFFSLDTAASFINFGALTAFTFVNLAVIAHYAVRGKMLRNAREILCYLVIPLIGAASMIVLWINLDMHSLILGLCWAALGFICLLYSTKGFRTTPGNLAVSARLDETV